MTFRSTRVGERGREMLGDDRESSIYLPKRKLWVSRQKNP